MSFHIPQKDMPFPYNLPIWRYKYHETSPNGKITAEIKQTAEVSMGMPGRGVLELSTGITLDWCNPSFVWSDDSRYLAVPQFFARFGLVLRQRLVVIDGTENTLSKSREFAFYFQPESFQSSKLTALQEPFHHSPKTLSWSVPKDFTKFRRIK